MTCREFWSDRPVHQRIGSIVGEVLAIFHIYTALVGALGKTTEMGKNFGFPHHPGALKYYKEKGWGQ